MKPTSPAPSGGPIRWMAGNSVASNLLMILLLVGGVIIGSQIKQEVTPDFEATTVVVTVSYPGASPEEVENGVILSIEEAVQSLEGIEEVTSTAREGNAQVVIEALDGMDVTRLWQEVQSEVARITTFPDEAKEPLVAIGSRKRDVMTLALHGKGSELALRDAAEQVRDNLLACPEITQVEMAGVRDHEVTIEIGQETLRRYNLTIGQVADIIRRASVELGGGSLKTAGGEILLRMNDRRDFAREFAQIPILSDSSGSRVLLGDIAQVRDDFEDTARWAQFNGESAVMLNIYRVGDQRPVPIATAAREVVEEFNASHPGSFTLSVKEDDTIKFADRSDLLLKNAYMGLALVFVCLALFLEIRLAFWVSLGIPISFLGAFLLLPFTDFSINMISMFAFIVTLGIVVDDAIVVGEGIYFKRRQGMPALQAAIEGARDIAMPVTFSVLTNIVAFLPLYFVPGRMGQLFGTIPTVVICVFFISLVESLFILPAHLGHSSKKRMWGPFAKLSELQQRFSTWFEDFVRTRYGALLTWILRNRYLVVAIGLSVLVATIGYVASGRMGMSLFPKMESDYAYAKVVLPYGASANRVRSVEKTLSDAAMKVMDKNGGSSLVTGIYTQCNDNEIQARMYLTASDVRPLDTTTVTRMWRKQVGTLPGIETITFESDRGGPGAGKGLSIQLLHRDNDVLTKAGEDLATALSNYSSVSDIDDGSARGKVQYDFNLLPAGERMGLTSREVANQVRNAFQGAEALQQQRGRNEITVRVRLPLEERELTASLENLVLRTPDGHEILLRDAATMTIGRAYTSITRKDGNRAIIVEANVTPRSQATTVLLELKKNALSKLMARYPGLSYELTGRQADMLDSTQNLLGGLLMALLAIYALLAIPFRSYTQPFIIMVCIPFGIIGSVWGLLLLGYSMSLIGLFGVVALSGVVVNDSLVLIDYANRMRRQGQPVFESIRQAGIFRFRPIMLTTLTTFGGLAPMIFETSRQAQFLIPMAITLGFGILFATAITLALVPSLYLILEDIHDLFATSSSDAPSQESHPIESA